MTQEHRSSKSRRLPASRFALPGILTLALLVWAWIAPGLATAHAPGLAIADSDLPLLAGPAGDAAVLSELPAGFEMFLTGDASGEYVEVTAADITGWVNVSSIQAGRIDTATTNAVTAITDAPSPDGLLLGMVPAGDTVILTGAAVDGYLAGSYDGTGGWLPAANLTR